MSNNTHERDILADILNDSQTGAVRGLDELSKLVHVTSRTERPVRGVLKPTKRTFSKKKREKKNGKRKTTHYLNEDVFENLDEAKKTLKEYLPLGTKTRATKSRIVESAVRVLLGEFKEKGEDSYLVKVLLKEKDTKQT